MIEQITDMPPGTIGIRASGKVTAAELREILRPALTEAQKAGPLRMLHLLEDGFAMTPGALRRDAKSGLTFGIEYDWQRFAIVTDVEWVRMAIHLIEFLVPGELRLFNVDQLADAKTWVAEPGPTEASRGLM